MQIDKQVLQVLVLPHFFNQIVGGLKQASLTNNSESWIFVTGSVKTGHNSIFLNSCLLNIYNLLSQVYPLAKFQLHMAITVGVTALQSSNNRKINCTARKINYRRLQKWL